MRKKIGIIVLVIVAAVFPLLYWVQTQRAAELSVDLGRMKMKNQLMEMENQSLKEALLLQDELISELQYDVGVCQSQVIYLEGVLDRYEESFALYGIYSISGWTYKPWQSKRELKDWLEANDVSEREYITTVYDCDDFAYDLFRDALADGRLIGIMRENKHQFNFAEVENTIYSIEPQTDRIEVVGRVD